MRGDQIKIFKIMKFLNMVNMFFNISPQTGKLLSRQISKTMSMNQLDLFANRRIFFLEQISKLDQKQ